MLFRSGGIEYGQGKSWGGVVPIGPRVLTVVSALGKIVRGPNDGGWTVSRPKWTAMHAWLGAHVEPLEEQAGTTEIVGEWLRAFGPGKEVPDELLAIASNYGGDTHDDWHRRHPAIGQDVGQAPASPARLGGSHRHGGREPICGAKVNRRACFSA